MAARPIWFPYQRYPNGIFLPVLTAVLRLGTKRANPSAFLVDTGAGITVAPALLAFPLADLSAIIEVSTGCLDASGRAILGKPLDVEVEIAGMPPVKERVYFSSQLRWGLLGQQSFLERTRGYFFNLPGERRHGRRFGLSSA